MSQIGITSPESEFAGWLEERAAILKMNNEHNTQNLQREKHVREWL